jgi:XTP/dITP diphosphohydrolase
MDECDLGAAFVLADDSGLEVDALGGVPGVHSARFAALDDGRKGNSPDAENNAKLLRLLSGVPEGSRAARFRCVLALTPVTHGASPDDLAEATRCFDGTCEGRIARAPSGQGGFGYDPLFIPEGHAVSFAELGEAMKNRLSHRARALAKLKAHLDGEPT